MSFVFFTRLLEVIKKELKWCDVCRYHSYTEKGKQYYSRKKKVIIKVLYRADDEKLEPLESCSLKGNVGIRYDGTCTEWIYYKAKIAQSGPLDKYLGTK